jgi:hypothetical protein
MCENDPVTTSFVNAVVLVISVTAIRLALVSLYCNGRKRVARIWMVRGWKLCTGWTLYACCVISLLPLQKFDVSVATPVLRDVTVVSPVLLTLL